MSDGETEVTDWLLVVGAGLALIMAGLQTRATRRARKAQLMEVFATRWNSKLLLEARDLTAGRSPQEVLSLIESKLNALPSGPVIPPDQTDGERSKHRDFYRLISIPDFFEDLEVSVEEGVLTVKLVDHWMGNNVLLHHERWREVIHEEKNPFIKKKIAERHLKDALERFDKLGRRIKVLRRRRFPARARAKWLPLDDFMTRRRPGYAEYIVNRRAQSTGEHEVHNLNAGCSHLPDPSNQRSLDSHVDCHAAIKAASEIYPQVDGCAYCAPDCHTR